MITAITFLFLPPWSTMLLLVVSLGVFCLSFQPSPTKILSRIIDIYLNHRHPIRSINGAQWLPSCSYHFPNGQGNEVKFFADAFAGRCREQYGSIYRMWSGFVPEIVLTRPDQISQVYKDSNMHVKGKNMDSGWLLGQLLGQCLGLLNQDRWTIVHKIFSTHFDRRVSLTYLPLIDGRVQQHLQLFETTSEMPSGQFLLKISKDLRYLAFFIIADVLYGHLNSRLEQQLRDIIPLREQLWKKTMKGGLCRFSVSQYFPSETNRVLREFQQKWKVFNKDALRYAQNNQARVPVVSLFAALENKKLSHAELLQTLDEILFANLDVTIGNFSWNPVFLAHNPKVQKELYDEFCKFADTDSSLQAYAARSDTLLAACIQESARLKPMAAFSLAQAAPRDCIVDGFLIPAGTNFVIDSQAVNILDPGWGMDAATYRPQRFLEGQRPLSLRYSFWRFGFGPRQCLGKHVADLLLKVVLIRMIERYQLQPHSKDGGGPRNWKRDTDVWICLAMQDIVCTRRRAGKVGSSASEQ